MQELIEAVKMSSQSSGWDKALVVIPIVISVIALFISLYIAYRQNKIALFEKRYRVVYLVKSIITFSEQIEHCTDETIYPIYMSTFRCDSDERSKSKYFVISIRVLETDLLTKEETFYSDSVHILCGVDEAGRVGAPYEKEKAELISACKDFKQKYMRKMNETVKL